MQSSTGNVQHGKESYYFSTPAASNPTCQFPFGGFYEQLFYSRYEIPHQFLLRFNYKVSLVRVGVNGGIDPALSLSLY